MTPGRVAAAPTPAVLAAILLAAVLLAGAPAPGAAQARAFPYELGRRDALLLPASAGVSLAAELATPEPQPLTRSEVAALSPDRVNAFARIAARSWSVSWATASDRSRDALLVSAVLV
ncbi:MAG: hypothetical protein FIA95_04140, partial [Gemmatimonadetes bacterium]|nr:hypothetical protein [Gemmatimonadota bacterium]